MIDVIGEDGRKLASFEVKNGMLHGRYITYKYNHYNKELSINKIRYYNYGVLYRVDDKSFSENTTYYKDGLIHREDGPAKILKNKSSYTQKERVTETWYKKGNIHRDNGPAVQMTEDGEIIRQEWLINNTHHNFPGPAIVTKDFEYYYFYGKRHKIGGPAYISRTCKMWFINDINHNPNGPCVIKTEKGTLIKEWRDKDGRYHRVDGPAIERINNGKITTAKYFIHGRELKTFKYIKRARNKPKACFDYWKDKLQVDKRYRSEEQVRTEQEILDEKWILVCTGNKWITEQQAKILQRNIQTARLIK
jgi:hypothetical protein